VPAVRKDKSISKLKSNGMDKQLEDQDETMKAMQRRIEEVWEEPDRAPKAGAGNAELEAKDKDATNPAAMAAAAGGTAGLGTDKNSGGNLGAPTGTGVHGHVGGTGTETPD
jgi:hypothetical protein